MVSFRIFSITFYCTVPPNVQPVSDSATLIALKNEDYIMKFSITEANPLVDISNIKWTYRTDPSSAPIPWPPDLEGEQQPRHHLSDDKQLLNIMDVQISDGGFYTLSASNSAGERNSTVMLLVYGEAWHVKPELFIHVDILVCILKVEPKFVNEVGDSVEGIQGETVRFNCSAYGIPAPNIVWKRNGQLVINTTNSFEIVSAGYNFASSQEQLDGTSSFLTVLSLATTDSGTYLCQADNSVGPGVQMETPYYLTVNGMIPIQLLRT